jgi:hypothetical protein
MKRLSDIEDWVKWWTAEKEVLGEKEPSGSGGLKDWRSKTTEGSGDPILDAVPNILGLSPLSTVSRLPTLVSIDRCFSYNPRIFKMRFLVGFSFAGFPVG